MINSKIHTAIRPLPHYTCTVAQWERDLAAALCAEFRPKIARRLPGHYTRGFKAGEIVQAVARHKVKYPYYVRIDIAKFYPSNRMKIYLFLLSSWLLVCTPFLIGCAQSQPNEKKSEKLTQFPMPVPPLMISTDPEAQAEYMVTHYWERYPFADTLLITNKAVTEQGFAGFISMLPYVKLEVAQKTLTQMMDSAQANIAMYKHFVHLAELYLYEPNSPYRNDEYYIPVLEHILGMEQLEEIDKYRPRYYLEMASKNRPGDKAADFSYKLRNGKSGTLARLKAEYVLLYLFNPDCHACDDIMVALKNDSSLNRMLAEKRLLVLAIYPDEDMDVWEKGKHKLPQEWLVGYDSPRVIIANQLYDLRATPTILLLDKEKRVILKDVRIDKLANYIQNIL